MYNLFLVVSLALFFGAQAFLFMFGIQVGRMANGEISILWLVLPIAYIIFLALAYIFFRAFLTAKALSEIWRGKSLG